MRFCRVMHRTVPNVLLRSPISALAITNAAALLVASPDGYAQTALCGVIPAGQYTSGYFCQPATGVASSLSTTANTSFSTTAGHVLRATGVGANATLSVTGTAISTSPPSALNGLYTQITNPGGTAPASDARIVIDGGVNAVTAAGAALDAVAIANATAGSSSVVVTQGTTLTIDNRVLGNEHDGIDINASGGGNAQVTHSGNGNIAVVGGNGVWVKATGSGNALAEVGNGVTFVVDNTDTSSQGNHAGVHTRSVNGSSQINNAARVQAIGRNAFGLFAETTSGDVTIQNSGSLTTNGVNGFGIRGVSPGGSVTIVNLGNIDTSGGGGHGIYVTNGTTGNGAVSIDNRGAISVGTTADDTGSRAINVLSQGTGEVSVTGNGDILVRGSPTAGRGYGIIVSAGSGHTSVNYGGSIEAHGSGAGGIRIDAATAGNVDITYTGARIETFNSNANGIYATTGAVDGTVTIRSQGTIITHSDAGGGDGSGTGSFGIQGLSKGADVVIQNTGPLIDVNGSGAAILGSNAYLGGQGFGDVFITSTGTLRARGNLQQGIRTTTGTGAQFIVNEGPIQTSGASGAQGIWANSSGGGTVSVSNAGAISTVGTGSSGIDAQTTTASVSVNNAGAISAGWGTSAGIQVSGATQSVANAGSIGALSDIAIRGDASTAGTRLSVDNSGQMTGLVTATGATTTLNNTGTWVLRNYVDTTGGGLRDTWRVATNDFGAGAGNAIVNNGVLSLAAQPATGVTTFDATGAYLPLGQQFNMPAAGGPVQGQLLGVSTFTNGGIVDVSGGGNSVAGNVLVISGARTAGTYGGGQYVSNGGRLMLNSVLNEGGANSHSDMLVVDAASTGNGGATRIRVNNVGGDGALTTGNGIALVDILSTAPSASDSGAFTLDRRVVAGPYEYRLFRGAEDGSGTNVWYLRSDREPDPAPLYRPEIAAYLANQRLAGQMFVHSLHDRLGEPQSVNEQGFNMTRTDDEASDKPKSGWLRMVGRWERSQSANGLFNVRTNAFLLHGGLEFADWSVLSETDRIHVGGMLSYGTANSNATAQGNPAHAQGKVEGWSLGAYATWYQNDEHKLGAYVDTWAQIGWFNNRVDGDTLDAARYHAGGVAVSGEAGYAIPLRDDWVVEPQAQIIYIDYHENDFTEPNGTRIGGANSSGLVTRLGIRTHRTWVRDDGRRFQPYFTFNWWRTTTDSSVSFNALPLGTMYPRDRFEAKLGLNALFGKRWTGWANVSGSWGQQDYRQLAVRAGVKYTW
ncbi:autotransporter outer membrane beta-barrel domain-containing protein [Pandoraea vervacti]|uniref:Autotransporter outer membrane beta-barrel domain-containing protein n=1 Tax=Pandoraea vervacti TaxID=656178 RepID=A0ABM6FQU1_9BURK|nr:autotransporter outer membrane beta-barrel domain-containing protein [Pandoraea vervacti]APD11182.1 autotransporter outer membrane beta-barrel domain-containing protein [Pandoraea vervacti]